MMRASQEVCDRDLSGENVYLAGGISGLLAGLIMGLAACWYSSNVLGGFWQPMAMISQGMFGRDPGLATTGGIMLGSGIHLVFSTLLGMGFSRLIQCHIPGVQSFLPEDRAMVSGAVYAVVVWAVMTHLILPVLNPSFRAFVMQAPYSWFVYHLLFGAVLLITPFLRSRVSASRRSAVARKNRVAA